MNNSSPPRNQGHKNKHHHRHPNQSHPQGAGPNRPGQGANPQGRKPQHHNPDRSQPGQPSRYHRSHRPHRPYDRQQQQQSHHRSNGGIDHILIQYDKLVDQHIEARKKFHELYYRCDNNRLNKLEDQFYQTSQRILKFERELRPWQLEQLKKQRTEIYPQDTTYSSLHPDEEKDKNTSSTDKAPVIHYHLTPSQLSRPSYREDTELTVGTMEDYLKYKTSN